MSATGFVRIKKLTGAGIVLIAARHNKRATQAEARAGGSIDPALSYLNYRLAGPDSPEDVAQKAHSLMKNAGVNKPRKNAVRAIEIVFSLPVGTTIDQRAYFTDCLRWASDRFGGLENVLSADVHLDESAPHCHVLILPLIGGRMVGSGMVGDRKVLTGHQASFHEVVASRYGLRRATARPSAADRRSAATEVMRRLREIDDPVLRSAGWALVRDAIERDPWPWASAMNVKLGSKSKKPSRSMTQIFTSQGKGPKREQSNPIGFGPPAEDQTLCSVGFAQKSAPEAADQTALNDPTTAQPGSVTQGRIGARLHVASRPGSIFTEQSLAAQQADDQEAKRAGARSWSSDDPAIDHEGNAPEAEPVRVRDCDQDPSLWNDETGEFVRPPQSPPRTARTAAEALVARRLESLAKHRTTGAPAS